MERVFFKKFLGEIIALFPDIVWDQSNTIASYQHIGQHGASSKSLVYLQNASEEEYYSLYKELVSLGYILKIGGRKNGKI